MRPTQFFDGMFDREEVASAFLALVLDGDPRFRRMFFELADPDEAESLSEREWTITVEERCIDVRMAADDTIVLIENKIAASAQQQGQLLRYHLQERGQYPEARIISIYLAPGRLGMAEIVRLQEDPQFQACTDDRAWHVSWNALSDYVPRPGHPLDAVVRTGLDGVEEAIARARQEKYPREGEREIIRDLADKAVGLMAERTEVSLRRWPGRDFEEIFTAATNVTMWLDAVFDVEKDLPFTPVGTRDEDGLIRLLLRSQFKLAGKVKKGSALGQWWSSMVAQGSLEIPGVGPHVLREDGWFVNSSPGHGTEDEIAQAMCARGVATLDTLARLLSSAGFDLSDVPSI